MTIDVKCPGCGKVIKVKLSIVDKLQAEIDRLKGKRRPPETPEFLNDIFKHFN